MTPFHIAISLGTALCIGGLILALKSLLWNILVITKTGHIQKGGAEYIALTTVAKRLVVWSILLYLLQQL